MSMVCPECRDLMKLSQIWTQEEAFIGSQSVHYDYVCDQEARHASGKKIGLRRTFKAFVAEEPPSGWTSTGPPVTPMPFTPPIERGEGTLEV